MTSFENKDADSDSLVDFVDTFTEPIEESDLGPDQVNGPNNELVQLDMKVKNAIQRASKRIVGFVKDLLNNNQKDS